MDDEQKPIRNGQLFLPSYFAGISMCLIAAAHQIPFLLGVGIVFIFHGLMKNVRYVPKNDNGGNNSNE